MRNESRLTAALSIDTKRSRIRIHRATLHQLDDPQYIQLLVDPAGMAVAVRRVDTPVFGDAVHTAGWERHGSVFSCEIYSRFFIDKLSALVPDMEEGNLYHMRGEVIPSRRAAVFDLKTLKRMES